MTANIEGRSFRDALKVIRDLNARNADMLAALKDIRSDRKAWGMLDSYLRARVRTVIAKIEGTS